VSLCFSFVALSEDLSRIAAAAAAYAARGEEVAGVVPAEAAVGERVYLCAFRGKAGETTWLALDERSEPVADRAVIRDAVSIAAMCELAEEVAAGGDLDDLLAQLVALRVTENPPGIDEAEDAVLALQNAIGAPPRVASPQHLDAVGTATRKLERALGDSSASPFAEAMKHGVGSVEQLAKDVEANYKRTLS
jgi:hypothetical protein